MAGHDPPYLNVGTDVSAKYRGAFCEAKVKKLVKCVKCKIYVKETQSSVLVTDEHVKGNLKMGAVVEVRHPESNQVVEGTITKMTDSSMYTVVFNDGDEKTLRRTQLCLKGEKHFIESETLDNLPLSHPEHFGTPVMNEKKAKRGRSSAGNEEDDEDTSSDESLPKRLEYKGRLQQLVGKAMMMEMNDKRKTQVPVLVVLPDAHSMELKTKDHMLVKSFKDNKFHSVLRKDLKDFTKDIGQKNEDKGLKAAFEKALLYYGNQDLPNTWERDELLGTDEEELSEDDESSDEEQCEEKDRFVAQLYKFMDDRGTPINKGPYIGNKDLNLYRLFKIVQNLGGYNKVTNQMKWRGVYTKMNLPPSNLAYHQVKNAYKKYLHAFEDFYRKLGSTMGTISRPGRSRHNSGRGVVAFKKDRDQEKKDDDKDSDDKKDSEDESKTEEVSNKRDRSPPKRVMRHDVSTKEEKSKSEDNTKEKKDDEETPKKNVKKELVVKKEEGTKRQNKVVVKKDEEKKMAKKEADEDKKVIRRRSMRKDEKEDESKVEDDKEEAKKEKSAEKETPKSKGKPVPAAKDEKKEKKEDKEKPKVTRKDLKKVNQKSDDDDMETEKSKTSLKREVKRMRGEEDSDVSEKGKVKEVSVSVKRDLQKKDDIEMSESKTGSAKKEIRGKAEKPKIEEEDSDSKGSDEFIKEVDPKIKNAEHPNGTKLQVRYGRGRNQKVYDAKIVEAGLDNGAIQYLVHYAGWNMRYDEWIKPERIVNVLNRPDMEKAKRSKESSPKTPKTTAPSPTMLKKRGRPGMTPPHPSTANSPASSNIDTSQPPVLVKSTKSPLSASKPNKNRPTRSNSIDGKIVEGLPVKMRRTRRGSGVHESSDINSQGSDIDESDQTEDENEDEDSKESLSAEHPDLEEEDVSVDYEDKGDQGPSVAAEMPKLENKLVQQEETNKTEDKIDKSENKILDVAAKQPQQISQSEEQTKMSEESSVLENNDTEKEKEMDSAPELVAVKTDPPEVEESKEEAPSEQNDGEKDVFKWEMDEEEDDTSKTCKVVTEIIDTIQSESDVSETPDPEMPQIVAPDLENCAKEEIPVLANTDKPAPEIKPEISNAKPDKNLLRVPVVDDRFEFRDDEDEITLLDLRLEADKELKERQKQDADILDKKVQKGKKKEVKEKKEVEKKEKKEIRKGKMTMAERKLVILPDVSSDLYEPVAKKPKDEKSEEKPCENVFMSSVDEAISSVCNKARLAIEENEMEKKKVKKKVKKKLDTSEAGEGKKEVGRVAKTPKSDKPVVKAKTKKNKDVIEGEKQEEQMLDCATGLMTRSEAKHDIDTPPVLSSAVTETGNKSKPVIKYDTEFDFQAPVLSGVELLSGVALMKENESALDQEIAAKECSGVANNNTVLDNTPPTTPEHDNMDSSPCPANSQEQSFQDPNKVPGISNVHEQHFGESPTGNTSPSSNDGSVGSGNVACSESSNTDVQVTSNVTKRRRESDDAVTPKKKRKGKSKTSERKSSKQNSVVGSDSDETSAVERRSPTLHSHKQSSSSSGNTPRASRYNLNLEEGKYLEGEKRISFLMSKIQEIRKVYMNLKSEVACIDRRRKRIRRKERESKPRVHLITEC